MSSRRIGSEDKRRQCPPKRHKQHDDQVILSFPPVPPSAIQKGEWFGTELNFQRCVVQCLAVFNGRKCLSSLYSEHASNLNSNATQPSPASCTRHFHLCVLSNNEPG